MKLTKEQQQEIKDQQSQENKTKRVTVANLENILYEAIPILDHGFIRVIDYMGDDTSIVQAARVSYGKGTKKVSTDSGLIKYLMRHWHSTPFEMCEIKYHVKLPIFIARQWIRHRTANVNEYSARYSILDKEFYLPAVENLAAQSQSNRQGRGDILTGDQAKKVLDLLNLMNFLRLRADSHAQFEIRAYADVMLDTLKKWVPITYEAFMDYRVGGAEVSSKGKIIIQKLIKGEKVNLEDSGLSKREWNELMDAFNFQDKLI